MGDTLAQRRGRIVQKIAAASPPSTATSLHGNTSQHRTVNMLDANTSAITQCNLTTTATLTDHENIAHAEWKHEALGKAQRYWSPA